MEEKEKTAFMNLVGKRSSAILKKQGNYQQWATKMNIILEEYKYDKTNKKVSIKKTWIKWEKISPY